ncbi:MAG: quinol dehydrogenase ferredoxin subunit NapH [Desulfobulbaceae bacterium]|nr:quinol dehydrogenase ferredoxin subunit NapH [Desulfobulbaceae bacterium]
MSREAKPGISAVAAKGWFGAHRWLLLRRMSQLTVLACFLAGPWAGLWILRGDMAASRLLDTVPLVDPYILLQSMAAGHMPAATALMGALTVAGLYLLVGGRAYCSWVCPLNMVTDLAAWLRNRLEIRESASFSATGRYWLLALMVVLAFQGGTVVWELVNPVTMVSRGLLFGMGFGWSVIVGIFLFDLLVAKRGWCGHLCPVGGFYSLLALASPLRVRAGGRSRCTNCLDCFAVCPEPQVIAPALRGEETGRGEVISSPNCTNCGRCIDVCPERVFVFGTRFDK